MKAWYWKYASLLLGLALFGITAIPYLQVRHFAFVEYDDPEYVYENSTVTAGVTPRGILWAFTSGHTGNWHPLTWLSHMTDCMLFGLEAGFHHLMNVFLHCCNAVALFLFLRLTTGSRGKSFLVALLFGLHPTHVESVAWISERKDVLSASFWFLTLLSYYWYDKKRHAGRYMSVLCLFTLGLMAKPMVVTLPLVLLLIDYWPLRRLRLGNRRSDAGTGQAIPFGAAFREKVPLLLLSLASCVVTVVAQHHGGALISIEKSPLLYRTGNAILSYGVYLWKMAIPVNLSVFYPHVKEMPWPQVFASLAVLSIITFSCVKLAGRFPFLLAGWLWYGITLVPVIGLVQVGGQAYADRYTYIPLTGIFIMIVWGSYAVMRGSRCGRHALAIVYGGICAACLMLSAMQTRHWKNGITLGEHAIAVTKGNHVGYVNLGCALVAQGRYDEAIDRFVHALTMKPDFADAMAHLGQACARKGDFDGAIACFNKALDQGQFPGWIFNDLGSALAEKGRIDEAVHYFKRALENKATRCLALQNLGFAEETKGDIGAAKEYYRQALRIDPNNPRIHAQIGFLLLNEGNDMDAKENFEAALQISPGWAPAREGLARCLKSEAGAIRAK